MIVKNTGLVAGIGSWSLIEKKSNRVLYRGTWSQCLRQLRERLGIE